MYQVHALHVSLTLLGSILSRQSHPWNWEVITLAHRTHTIQNLQVGLGCMEALLYSNYSFLVVRSGRFRGVKGVQLNPPFGKQI